METYYDVLGLAPSATSEEIRRAYRRAVKNAHPDAGGDPDSFQAVHVAWCVLGDPNRRAAYDARTGPPPTPGPTANPRTYRTPRATPAARATPARAAAETRHATASPTSEQPTAPAAAPDPATQPAPSPSSRPRQPSRST